VQVELHTQQVEYYWHRRLDSQQLRCRGYLHAILVHVDCRPGGCTQLPGVAECVMSCHVTRPGDPSFAWHAMHCLIVLYCSGELLHAQGEMIISLTVAPFAGAVARLYKVQSHGCACMQVWMRTYAMCAQHVLCISLQFTRNKQLCLIFAHACTAGDGPPGQGIWWVISVSHDSMSRRCLGGGC
jgi:hypothetical protein